MHDVHEKPNADRDDRVIKYEPVAVQSFARADVAGADPRIGAVPDALEHEGEILATHARLELGEHTFGADRIRPGRDDDGHTV